MSLLTALKYEPFLIRHSSRDDGVVCPCLQIAHYKLLELQVLRKLGMSTSATPWQLSKLKYTTSTF